MRRVLPLAKLCEMASPQNQLRHAREPDGLARALGSLRRELKPGDVFRFRIVEGQVHLQELRLKTTGTGQGTRFLAKVCALLDQHAVEATGVVDPTEFALDPDTATLLRWYARFGFAQVGVDEFERPVIRRAPAAGQQERAGSAWLERERECAA